MRFMPPKPVLEHRPIWPSLEGGDEKGEERECRAACSRTGCDDGASAVRFGLARSLDVPSWEGLAALGDGYSTGTSLVPTV